MLAPSDVWTDAAATWPVVTVSRETDGPRQISNYDPATGASFVTDHERLTQTHVVCSRCDQSVFCLAPGTGEGYRIMWADVLSGILAHLRLSHPDLITS